MYIEFGVLERGSVFIFQGEKLIKTHFHYITNGFKEFPANAKYITGCRKGDEVFFKHNVEINGEYKL